LFSALRLILGLLLLALSPPLAAVPLFAQDTTRAGEQSSPAPPPLPGPLEVTARYRALTDSAVLAEREIARVANVEALAADIATARQRQAQLQALLATVAELEYVRPERISRVRDQALIEDQRLDALLDHALERLEQLGSLRAEWLERQRFWVSWRDTLRADPEYPLLQPELRQALARIGVVLGQIGDAVPEILTLQREIEQLRAQTHGIIERVAAIRMDRREVLLRRDQPVLFSPAFQAQLRDAAWREWRPAPTSPEGAAAFLSGNGLLLFLHLVAAVLLALVARRLRRFARPEEGWSGMLRHPVAVGVFAATALVARHYGLTPPLWDVVIWSLLAGSGAVVATRMLASWPLRLMVYFVAAIYPLFLLLEATRMPVPLFRLGLAGVSAAGLLIFALLAYRSARSRSERKRAAWIASVGAGMWAVVLAAEILGFYLLARWILHATVTSALLVFVVAFLVVLARGGIHALLRLEAKGRWRFLRRVGVPFVERLVLLLEVVLVMTVGLVLLDVWELTASPLETWNRIVDAGVTIAGVRVTLGRLMLAVLMVYIAVLISWLLRTFVDTEAQRRWELDRGVGESINTLVHYFLITAGLLFALGALGVELQNFAIVAGALGIGIGFGLQNVVNNFVSGLILLFERPVRVGDTVVIGGEWGTIRKIGLRSTVVLTFDQSEMIVPNGDLVSEKVTNWTLSNPIARLLLSIGVAYGSDVEKVLRILLEAASVHPAVLSEPSPSALFAEFGDSSLNFELRVWVRDISLRLEVRSRVLTEVDRRFRAAGIEIPFPHRDLHLRAVDPAILDAVSALKHEERTDGQLPDGAAAAGAARGNDAPGGNRGA
jgi:small-conductance mechanosensitive channel